MACRVVATGVVISCDTDEEYADRLAVCQTCDFYSNVVGDAAARTITFDVDAPA